MGDRANVYVVDEKNEEVGVRGIYLYTHWSGSEWPEVLRYALAEAEPRWGDAAYCTRILISRMFENIHNQETGGGVSTYLTDNSYPILVVDQIKQTVSITHQGLEKDPTYWERSMSFKEFIALPIARWSDFGHGEE